MLDRKFRKKGLNNFRYKDTQWYTTIRSETRAYKTHVLLFVLCASLIIPISFALTRSLGQPGTLPFAVYNGVFLVLARVLSGMKHSFAYNNKMVSMFRYIPTWELPSPPGFISTSPILCCGNPQRPFVHMMWIFR